VLGGYLRYDFAWLKRESLLRPDAEQSKDWFSGGVVRILRDGLHMSFNLIILNIRVFRLEGQGEVDVGSEVYVEVVCSGARVSG